MNLFMKSLASLLTIFVMVVATLPYFFIYSKQTEQVELISVAIEQKDDIVAQNVIKSYYKEYEDKGIKITSTEIDYNSLQSLATKERNLFNSTFYCIKLTVDGKNYYFKSEQDSNKFKNEINNIKQKDINAAEVSIKNIAVYSSEDDLNEMIAAVKEEKRQDDIRAEQERLRKEKEEQERKQREQQQIQLAIASRSGGGESRREVQYSNYGGGAPIESYVYISSHFGESSSRRSSYHTGTDFAAAAGTKIYAWQDGTVITANWSGAYGNMVAIDHGNGLVTRYAHMSGYAVSNGQYVTKGQVIGYVGSTRK